MIVFGTLYFRMTSIGSLFGVCDKTPILILVSVSCAETISKRYCQQNLISNSKSNDSAEFTLKLKKKLNIYYIWDTITRK